MERTCPNCGGVGKVITSPCGNCGGAGRIEKDKTLSVNIPSGVEDGTQMRLGGKGEPGPGGPGDALITIQIQPHAFFTQDGDDLRLDLPITLDEALNGAKVKAPTASGAVRRRSRKKKSRLARAHSHFEPRCHNVVLSDILH